MRTGIVLITLFFCSHALAEENWIHKGTGRAPGKGLVIKKTGVPQLIISKKIKNNIPRIDIGEEATINVSDLTALNLPRPHKIQTKALEKVQKAKPIAMPKTKITADAKSIVKKDPKAKPIPFPTYTRVDDPKLVDNVEHLQKVEALSKEELTLLQALIFKDNKNKIMAAGIFSILLDEKNASVRQMATYEYAMLMSDFKIYTEFRQKLLRLVKEGNSDWQKKAVTALAERSESEDLDLIPILDAKLEQWGVDLDNADQYQINRAKYYMEKSDLSKAYSVLENIDSKSNLFGDAKVFKSLILYRAGKVKEALTEQTEALAILEKNKNDSEIKSISALTLARLHFQLKNWKEAFNNYLKVQKNHPEWPEAMVEQAWSQILSQDYEGAAGNMYTLHTDFFKSRFAPESYVVRAVGYLNLCQYGDGAKVVFELQKKYSSAQKAMGEIDEHKNPLYFYETIKTAFKTQDTVINGLPKSLVFELARNPQFMAEQTRINQSEEQLQNFSHLTQQLAQQQQDLLTQKLDPKSKERLTIYTKIYSELNRQAQVSLRNIKPQLEVALEKNKTQYKQIAEKSLRSRFAKMTKELGKSLEQAEVLKYEIYSGAGEHLRLQMAGGDVNKQAREQLKVEDGKSMKWDFHGEVWEDELGHFRSSLKNVCGST